MKTPPLRSPKKHPKGSGTARIYMEIREKILNLELAPGTYLDEGTLERTLGVSRTPVREALIRLGSEGLILQEPNRGATVAPIGLDSMRQFFEALDLTDRAVTRWAAVRRSGKQLEQILKYRTEFEDLASTDEQAELLNANNSFHIAIAQACGNSFLEGSYRRLVGESVRLARITLVFSSPSGITPRKHLDKIIDEHRAITQAISDQDAEQAELLAQQHARLFRSRVDDFLQENLAFDIAVERL